MERLFGLPSVKIFALLTAMDCINSIVKFVPWDFVLGVSQFLFQYVEGSEANWDVILRENSA